MPLLDGKICGEEGMIRKILSALVVVLLSACAPASTSAPELTVGAMMDIHLSPEEVENGFEFEVLKNDDSK